MSANGVTSFHPSHLTLMDEWVPQAVMLNQSIQYNSPYSWTLVAEDKPILCMGAEMVFRGVLELWMTPDRLMARYPKFVYRTCRELLAGTIQATGAHRIQCLVREDFPAGIRWAERFGLVREGTKHCLDLEKNNYHIYAWWAE